MQPPNLKDGSAPCTCMKDGFATVPPEMRPRPQKKSSLRKVTCPGCGLDYWTNREGDVCMECEKKGVSTLTNKEA